MNTENQQIYKMLSQLDETLRMVLNSTGVDLKKIASAVSKGNEISEDKENSGLAVALQLSKEQKNNFDILKSEILRSAEEVTQGYKKAVEESEKGMRTQFEQQYIAKSDIGEYTSEMKTSIEQNSESVAMQAENIESVQTALTEYKKGNNAELAVQAEQIVSQVEESFVSKSEIEDIEEKLSSNVIQSSDNIKETFSKEISVTNKNLEEINNEFVNFKDSIDVYIKRGLLVEGEVPEDDIYGIEIGRSDSNIIARFTNEKLSFIQGKFEVAYISGSNLYITRAEILDYLKIGNDEQGYFTFDVSDYGLEVRWNG
ncbi:MAG: hypothetical protein ACI4IF_02300 [Acutalibacteraceae bacterium]